MRKAEKMRKNQVDLTLKKVRGLSEKDRESLETMTRALVQEILREPIERIEEGNEQAESYVEIVRKLFRLDTEESE
jgi:glutamyl-tRNA reductase